MTYGSRESMLIGPRRGQKYIETEENFEEAMGDTRCKWKKLTSSWSSSGAVVKSSQSL